MYTLSVLTDWAGSDDPGISIRVALGVALALLVAVRLFPFGSVFSGSDVVLLSNDPYSYLYHVERVVAAGVLQAPSDLSGHGEPLLVWLLAFLTTIGGGLLQADVVLAWYPVGTAIVSGLLVFVLARTLTDDVRIALAAVVVLAVTPLHASRTALGFADHHAFDYLWAILTATALVWLLVRTDVDRRRRWAMGAVLGVAIAAQTLAWEASPLLLVPTAGAVAFASLVVVRTAEPTRTLAPVVAGFGLAAVLVQAVHQTLSWQSTFVAGTPVLLFVGGLILLGLLAAVQRVEGSWPALLGAQLATVAVLALVALVVVPDFVGAVVSRFDAFGGFIQRLGETGIGETRSITAAYGPLLGPIILLGFGPFLGLPAMVWGVYRGLREREPAWLALAVYVLWFLVLAFLQRRWAIQLGLFLSVFAGVGFIAFAHWLALVLPPMPLREDTSTASQQTIEPPDRSRLALLGGLGAVGIGSGALFSRVILEEISIDDPAYRAAAWMREYATDQGWSYPDNYVLADWGRARMYNHFVNGQSSSYGYARRHYSDFVFSTEPTEWYDQFADRVGFIVTRGTGDAISFRVQGMLHGNYGSASSRAGGVGHYRAMWESDDETVKVFTLVPGVTLSGRAAPESDLAFSTTVTLAGTGNSVTYRRTVTTDAEGNFSVVLAHPGEYRIADRDETVTVDETAVRDGDELTLRL